MLGALAWAIITGDWHVFFLATLGERYDPADLTLVLLVLVAAGLRGWLIWTVLVRPPFEGPLWMRVLRVLLYLNAALVVVALAVPIAGYAALLLTLPVVVMTPLVFRQAPLAVRVVVAVAGVASLVVAVVLDLPGAAVGWPIAVVLLQVFCGWSPLTRWLGLAALVHAGVMSMLPSQFTTFVDLSRWLLLLSAFAVVQALWLAHTAADLSRDHTTAPLAFRMGAVVLASVVAGTVVVAAMRAPVETLVVNELTSGEEDPPDFAAGCEPWTLLGQEYVATPPNEREKAYLCLAGQYDERSDAELLADGRNLCAAETLYGGTMERLVYLCPERVAEVEPGLLLGRAVVDAMHAACADPWPRVRSRGDFPTMPYLLEKPGEGYRVVTQRLHDGPPGLLDDVPVTVGAGVQGVCLTYKTLKQAPPLRADEWRSVVEVPLLSHGSVALRGLDANFMDEIGEGRQHMRVYTRDLTVEGLRAEQHLIVTFPGRSARVVVHK
ncbi:hypothetical protein [Herbidospora sp. NBRC 101105]|uniref:hypothetical protein n=1 Tax=Herbidospora sp. NBRC 101105 TaxID=3032195 RepID=UPI0024A085D1|nr:hypothetical protein [Herbidospora sp. NBRC 101105]GLX97812.1 hypothetical protein Hesp01_57620 [Herbidospora sp. NBRC 101105]